MRVNHALWSVPGRAALPRPMNDPDPAPPPAPGESAVSILLGLAPIFLVSSPAQRDSYLGATTSEPKRPWPSSKGPAVKKRVFVGALFGAPLPRAIAQRPSMAIGGLSDSL